MKRHRRRTQAGVTLIEMLVVVAIMGLFVALVGPNLFRRFGGAQVTTAKAQITNLIAALGTYRLDNGTFPTTEQGLQALRVKPETAPQWNGPYLPQDVPKDPWGHDYAYKYPGEHGDEPDIICFGQDGKPGGEGMDADLYSWKK